MAAPKKSGGLATSTRKKDDRTPKKTTIGHSRNTHFKSKHDKRSKKAYRGQG